MSFFREKKGLFSLAVALCAISGLTSCLYQMPTDDDLPTVPLTNNPEVTKDPNTIPMPGP